MKCFPALFWAAAAFLASGTILTGVKSMAAAPPECASEQPASTVQTPAPEIQSAADSFVAVTPDNSFTLPNIVLQYDPATETGYDWEKLDKLPLYELLRTHATVVFPVRTRPFSFSTLDEGFTQSPIYFYIPKGTKSLDFELWGREYAKTLQLHTGLPGSGLKPSRRMEVSRIGTHRVALNPGEDGSIASLGGDMFNVPRLYSVPQLWAKSPAALLVPRAITAADGLTEIQRP